MIDDFSSSQRFSPNIGLSLSKTKQNKDLWTRTTLRGPAPYDRGALHRCSGPNLIPREREGCGLDFENRFTRRRFVKRLRTLRTSSPRPPSPKGLNFDR